MSNAPSFIDIWAHGDLVHLGANERLPSGGRYMRLIASYPAYVDALDAALPYLEKGWAIRDDVRGATVASFIIDGGAQ
jgi:hypothetical protein